MVSKFFIFLLSLSFLVFIGCDDESSTEPEEQVNEFNLMTEVGDDYFTNYTTASGGVNYTVESLYTLLNDGDDTNDPFIIDFRAAADYDNMHITGAVNIALADLIDAVEDGTIPTDRRILNVCYTGQNASVATSVLNMLGYDAQNLKFGMCAVDPAAGQWAGQVAADEYTLNKTAVPAPTTEYDFPVIETGNKTADEIFKDRFTEALAWGINFSDVIANPQNYFIVNYWGADDYNNIGHIEGAYQFTPKVALNKDEMLKYLPTDQTIVIYCWTGQTSAQVVPYLRMLGYDAKSLKFGVNGFAFGELPDGKPKFHGPDADYSSILE